MKSGFVALAGRPNAGKSTLLNALLQEKLAIVSPKPQTTRSEIRGILNLKDAQIIFTDTPGIHKPGHRLETRMNRQASNVIQGGDVVYLVVDGSVPYSSGDEYVLRMIRQLDVPVFLLLNKIDLMPREKVLKVLSSWQKRYDFAEFFPVSAAKQGDFEDLIATTLKYLPEGEAMYPQDMTNAEPLNFRMAELIREKILYCTEEEVPHATAVLVEDSRFAEDHYEVRALVMVEKQGQKAIVIGRQGRMIGRIISQSEKELEKLLGAPVALDLYVRVEEEWRDRDHRITEYGYGNIDE